MAETSMHSSLSMVDLAQSVQECLTVFAIWDQVEISSDFQLRSFAQIQFLSAKLHWWAVGCGILNFGRSASVIENTQVEVHKEKIWNCMSRILFSARNLSMYQGIAESEKVPFPSSQKRPHVSFEVNVGEPGLLQARLELTMQGDVLTSHLEDILNQINTLEKFAPPDSALNGTVIFNKALDACLPQIERLSERTDIDKFTASIAQLKAVSLTHINVIQTRPLGWLLPLKDPIDILRRNDEHSSWGNFRGEKVFLHEKKAYLGSAGIAGGIGKIIRQLEIADSIEGLRILPCMGYTLECLSQNYDTPGQYCQYTTIYSTRPHSLSLRDMLSPEYHPRLQSIVGMRLAIAKSLAKSILYLHTAECHHRAIRSSNVIFSSDLEFSDSSYQFELPYLAGFDYPRTIPCEEWADVKGPPPTEERHLYRHPGCWGDPRYEYWSDLSGMGSYSKDQDVYGLGVILIELSLLIPVKRIWKHFCSKIRPSQSFQEYLVHTIIPKVRLKMGTAYANAALYCLETKVYSSSGSCHVNFARFYENVVRHLEESEIEIFTRIYLLWRCYTTSQENIL